MQLLMLQNTRSNCRITLERNRYLERKIYRELEMLTESSPSVLVSIDLRFLTCQYVVTDIWKRYERSYSHVNVYMHLSVVSKH